MTLPQLIAQSVEVGVRRAVGRYVTQDKLGLAIGATILTLGMAAESRRRRRERIERKLDNVAEQVDRLAAA